MGVPSDSLILEDQMECLVIDEPSASPCGSAESSPVETAPRRSTRRKSLVTENRRVLTTPKKNSTASSVESIYLCKKIKRLPPNLETIFEEPKVTKANQVLYLGLKKQKRVISFTDNLPNKSKVKKRQMKAKKMFGKGFNVKKKRASMEALLEKLKCVEN